MGLNVASDVIAGTLPSGLDAIDSEIDLSVPPRLSRASAMLCASCGDPGVHTG